MLIAYSIIAFASVSLWFPILVRFYRKWRERGNPISLAISAAIGLLIWTSIAGLWYVAGRVTADVVVVSTGVMSVLSGIAAHMAFYWSKKKFPDQRKVN